MVAEKVFAVIAESTRRDILEALAQESKAVGQLVDELGVSQPTVSKHLRVLREAGVVTMRAQGQKRFYGINAEPLALVSAWLDSLGAVATPAEPGSAVQTVRPAAKAAEVSKGGAPAQSNGHERAAAAHAAAAQTRPASVGVPVQASGPGAATASPAAPGLAPAVAVPSASSAAPAVGPGTGTAAAWVTGAASAPVASATANGHRPASASVARLAPAIVQSNDGDGGMQGQISRSVGRAANKAVDLLANLPALPKLRRKKD